MTDQSPNSGSKVPVLKAAWDRYAKAIEDLRQTMEAAFEFDYAPEQRAMGYRQLVEVQAMVYNFVVAPRTAQPRIYRNTSWQNDQFCIGGAGPDFDYRNTYLDGAHTYRITGRFNDTRWLTGLLMGTPPGNPSKSMVANRVSDHDFTKYTLKPDGSFEVIASADRHEGNWIPLVRESSFQWLMFRPLVESYDDVPAELEIERISPLPDDRRDADEYSEEEVARRIDFAANMAPYVLKAWGMFYTPMILKKTGGTNRFWTPDDEGSYAEASVYSRFNQCVYEVEDDEALIFEFKKSPAVDYWSLAMLDVWNRSYDYRSRQTSLNFSQVSADADGGIRVVVSRRDPGVANWIDNAGYKRNQLIYRTYSRAPSHARDGLVQEGVRQIDAASLYPEVRRIKFADLKQHLPQDTRRLTPEQRQAELKRRRNAYLRRHGE